jgi:hypothetical protein
VIGRASSDVAQWNLIASTLKRLARVETSRRLVPTIKTAHLFFLWMDALREHFR